MLIALIVALTGWQSQAVVLADATLPSVTPAVSTKVVNVNIENLIVKKQQPDYDREVLEPLKAAQKAKAEADAKAAAEAEAKAKAEAEAEAARQAELERVSVVQVAQVSYVQNGELSGSYGYSSPYGNCVNEPGVNNPHDGTNPISWSVTSQTPWIGASVLFYFNHVAVVTGIWSNGDIEVRHQNSGGAPTRYPRSMIRGFR